MYDPASIPTAAIAAPRGPIEAMAAQLNAAAPLRLSQDEADTLFVACCDYLDRYRAWQRAGESMPSCLIN